jgi:hypothetical protein
MLEPAGTFDNAHQALASLLDLIFPHQRVGYPRSDAPERVKFDSALPVFMSYLTSAPISSRGVTAGSPSSHSRFYVVYRFRL